MDILIRVIACITVLFFVSSCGGGGGDNANNSGSNADNIPPVTPPPSTSGPESDLFTKYHGLKTKAKVDRENAYDIAHHSTTISDIALVLAYGNEFPYARFDSALVTTPPSTSEDCDSGALNVGEQRGDSVSVEYVNCKTNNYTLNGKGKLEGIEFDSSGELVVGRLSFDALSVNNGRTRFTFQGQILATLGDDSTDEAIYDALVESADTGEQYYLDEYTIGLKLNNDSQDYGVRGKLYLSSFGFVEVETLRESNFESGLSIAISGNNTLVVEQLDRTNIGLGLFDNDDYISESRTKVPFSFLDERLFEHQNNTAPVANISFSHPRLNKDEAYTLSADGSSDKDKDLLNYHWEVISKPQNATVNFASNGFVNARATFDTAGDYKLRLTVDDGKLQAEPASIELYVKQSVPNASFSVGYSELGFSEQFRDEVILDNPPDDGPFTLSLYTAPQGMRLSEGGILEWDGAIPRVGYNIDISYKVKISNKDHEVFLDNTLTLTDETPNAMLKYSEYPKKLLKQLDFDNDQKPDLFVTQGVLGLIVSATTGDVLWSMRLPSSGVNSVYFSKSENTLYLLETLTGKLYSVDITSKDLKLVTTLDFPDLASFSDFRIIGSAVSSQFDFLFQEGIINLYTGEKRIFPDTPLYDGIGDIDSDGVAEIFTQSGIYRTDDNTLVARNNNINFLNLSSVELIDINNDNNAEIFLVSSLYEAEDARYDLSIYSVKGNDIVPIQTIKGTKAEMSYVLSDDREWLYIVEGASIGIYRKDENSLFAKVDSRAIDNFRYEYNHPYDFVIDPCQLISAHQMMLVLRCFGKDTVSGETVSNYSYLDLNKEKLNLEIGYDINEQYENFFGNIVKINEENFVVGQRLGALYVNSDDTTTKQSAPLELIDEGYSFHIITQELGETFAWEFLSAEDVLAKTDLVTGASITYPVPRGGFPSFDFFTLGEESYVYIRDRGKIYILLQSNLQEVAQYQLETLYESSSAIYNSSTFSYNKEDYAVLWLGDSLIFLKEDNGDISLDREVQLPNSSEDTKLDGAPRILTVEMGDSGPQINLLEERSGASVFTYISYLYAAQEFSSRSIDTPLNTQQSFQKFDFCSATDPKSNRTVAYAISNSIAVDPEFAEEQWDRPLKLTAIDMNSGELIWKTDNLYLDESPQGEVSIKCSKETSIPRLLFSTRNFLYMTL